MTPEELARNAYEAFNRADYAGVVDLCVPDIVLQRPGGAGDVQGRDAVKDFWAPDAFEWQRIEPEEFAQHGDRLLISVRGRVRGAESGIEVEQRMFQVLAFRDGKVARIEVYLDRADALEAVEQSRADGP